jgi:hypothetical protein
MEERRKPSSHEMMCLSTPAKALGACCTREKAPIRQQKQPAEFYLIFRFYPVEITQLRL